MTVLLATGFEHGTHEILPAAYYSGVQADASSAHTGSYGLDINPATSGNRYWIVPITPASSVYVSFWWKPVNITLSNSLFIDAYSGSAPQAGIYLSNTLVWSAQRGASTVLATASAPLPDYEWHHYKLYIYIADSFGRVKLDIDSINVIDFTGDTKPSTATTTDRVFFGAYGSKCYLDDLIIDDAQNWVDVRFNGLIPNSDVTTDWTPSTGSTHYTLVDEVPYDDADYLETNTDAQQEIYGLTDWTGTNKTPQMTVTWVRALKTTADTQKLKLIVKSGATTDVGTAQDVYTTATYLNRIDETDPNTGVAWTDSGVDAMQIGYESEI